MKKSPELKKLVTFIPNKKESIHNWYYYKEGFSKQFVELFLKQFDIQKDETVLDPFCGVGTTNLTCKQHGVNSVGFDVSPLCIFVSDVKTRHYNLEELEGYVRKALKWKFERPKKIPQQKWLKKMFSPYVLEDIVFYRKKIMEIKDEKIRNFLMLGLIDAAMKSSYAYKDGAFVRVVKRGLPPLKKVFHYKIRKMLRDVREFNPDVEPKVEIADCRDLPLKDKAVDYIITSPPYLNKIEYTKIYKTEYELFFQLPETKIRSFISETEDAYFEDMEKCLKEMRRVCRKRAAIVIGGGCFPDRVVEVDKKIAELAEQIGWKLENILVARTSWCTRARTIKVGQVRESILIFS